ncbi:uncharacterized protein LOC131432136 [Malaya genurostris]|uniref:uncharacterized protein LOC131432136 n=1 Tax=Malaya genurostris TaxID=325434 RepID=UPI0026F409E1|nr:uncharacterized protein LOC131432136 [Malaya genurostris]XP_058454222.1 uncharacterized protein LOC131432136 [Malaya genurostris]
MSGIPTIAITTECSDDEIEDVANLSINEAHTDTEDLIMEQDTVRFRKNTKNKNSMIEVIKPTVNGSVTDVEDCTDSDDYDDDGEGKSAKEADIVLDDFLDQGYTDETTQSDCKGEKPKTTSHISSVAPVTSSLQVFVDTSNALTDCEDMSDDGDDDSVEKSSIPDCPDDILMKDNENDAVAIHNVVRRRQDKHFHKQEAADESSSDSEVDTSVRHRKCHRRADDRPKSEYENFFISDDEKAGASALTPNRQAVLFDAEELVMESSDVEDDKTNQFPEINISFVCDDRSVHIKPIKKIRPSSLMVQAPNPDEALTDVENLDSSESDDDTELMGKRLLPIAVVRPGRGAAGGTTDVEDFNDSDDYDEQDQKPIVTNEFLPSPVREIAVVKHGESGNQRQNVMPLNQGMLTVRTPDVEQALTDVEDMSDNEDGEEMYDTSKYAIESLPEAVHDDVYSSDCTRANNVKLEVKKSTCEPITDTEDLFFERSASNSGSGSELRRRRKPKHAHGYGSSGHQFKGKKFLDMKLDSAQTANTDVEDLYLSDDAKDCGFERTKQRRATIQCLEATNDYDGKTDVEFLSGDELTNDCAFQSPQISHDGFSSITKTLERNGPTSERLLDAAPVPMIRRISPGPDTYYCNTDCEDIQVVSDGDDESYSRAQTATPMELTRALQESGSSEIYDTSSRPKSELLDVKGMVGGELQEIHTDVEFLEDDLGNAVEQ